MTQSSSRILLFSGPLSMFGAKAQIAAIEKGLDVDVVMVPFDMDRLYEPKHPEILRINPKRQVPVLIHGDVEIFDSTQIFEYLEDMKPEPPLWPTGPEARARARLLELKSDEVYFPHIIRLMGLQDDPTIPPRSPPGKQPAGSTKRWTGSSATTPISRAPTATPTSPSTWRSSSVHGWAQT